MRSTTMKRGGDDVNNTICARSVGGETGWIVGGGFALRRESRVQLWSRRTHTQSPSPKYLDTRLAVEQTKYARFHISGESFRHWVRLEKRRVADRFAINK